MTARPGIYWRNSPELPANFVPMLALFIQPADTNIAHSGVHMHFFHLTYLADVASVFTDDKSLNCFRWIRRYYWVVALASAQ